jgi:hypothetical protein
MRITIDRNLCGAWTPACEECFSVFVARGFPIDRACITGSWEDGSNDVTAVIRSGHYVGTLKITPENRDAIMCEGWPKFANLPDAAFDIQPPHGDYVRTTLRQG